MSTTDHHSLLEYTNSLEGALEDATKHDAAITLDNTTILKKLDAQQKTILEQQAKFMALLSQTDLTPFAPRNQRNRLNAMMPTEGRRVPRFCNSCKKEKCYHEDDECFVFLEKSKDKRPSWYKPKKEDPAGIGRLLSDYFLNTLVTANKRNSRATKNPMYVHLTIGLHSLAPKQKYVSTFRCSIKIRIAPLGASKPLAASPNCCIQQPNINDNTPAKHSEMH